MRCAGRLALRHQFVEIRLGIGIGIVRDRRQQREIALRRHSLMRAVHRKVAVAHRVHAGVESLVAPVGSLSREPQDTQKSSLRDGEGN